jgi:hypothetical protein
MGHRLPYGLLSRIVLYIYPRYSLIPFDPHTRQCLSSLLDSLRARGRFKDYLGEVYPVNIRLLCLGYTTYGHGLESQIPATSAYEVVTAVDAGANPDARDILWILPRPLNKCPERAEILSSATNDALAHI